MSQQQQDNDLEEMEEIIEEYLQNYEKAVKENDKTANEKLQKLEKNLGFYSGMVRTPEQKQNYQRYKKRKNLMKYKGLSEEKKQTFVPALQDKKEQVKQQLNNMTKDLAEANTTGQQLMKKLNQQIERLDDVYELNMQTQTQLKRINKHLRTLLINLMKQKLIRLLLVLLICAIVALVIVHFVKKK